jgi:two-component system chemotaxis response regulator CheY
MHAFKEFSYNGATDAYLCHDDDLFILGRSWSYKRLQEFLSSLSPKLAPAPLSLELASLFEIGVDWPRIRALCTKKIENIELLKQQSAPPKELLKKANPEDAFKTLDKDLISSLAMRRDMRDNIEVMVVEDDPFSQKLAKNALNNKYSYSMTDDGQGAVMNYIAKAPDVLFLDIGLPDIDGHAVLKKIFELDPHAYIVMFSGNGDKENVMKAIQLGAKGFVGKPFTKDKLLQYLNKSPFVISKNKKNESPHETVMI